MSSEKTSSLGLHKWKADDNFLREEFNENFTKLDKAIADDRKKVASDLEQRVAYGCYRGTDEVSQTIALPFTPKAVIIIEQSSVDNSDWRLACALASYGCNCMNPNGSGDMVVLVEKGFKVKLDGHRGVNHSGYWYNYAAIR